MEQILLIAGAVCFAISALGIPVRQINLVALGLLFWILTLIIV